MAKIFKVFSGDARSVIVRYRPRRGDKRNMSPRGVIYMSGGWIGMEAKLVRRSLWVILLKRLHKAEATIAKIGRIAK